MYLDYHAGFMVQLTHAQTVETNPFSRIGRGLRNVVLCSNIMIVDFIQKRQQPVTILSNIMGQVHVHVRVVQVKSKHYCHGYFSTVTKFETLWRNLNYVSDGNNVWILLTYIRSAQCVHSGVD